MAGIMAHVSLPKFHAESEFNLCFHLCVMNFTFKLRFYFGNLKQSPKSKADEGICMKERSKQRLNLDSA